MEPQPATSPRSVRSFEFDSLLWWKRSGIWIAGIFLLVGLFAGSVRPRVYGGRGKKATQTEAVSNARQIGLALSEFQREYGSYPDANTIEKVRQNTGTDLHLGTRSSNDFFRQLLASGKAGSEAMFFAKINGCHKPDNVFTGLKALEKGECAFSYLTGAFPDCDPGRPIAITPMIPGTDRFDPKPFDGKAVMLRADNSSMSIPIRIRDGHVTDHGQNLMDPANPIWEGKPPVIVWPE